MNNTMQKMMLAFALCAAFCGTAFAAPKGNAPHGGKAPAAMKAPARNVHAAKKHAPAKHKAEAPARTIVKVRPAPAHEAPRHVVIHHEPPAPPPPAIRHEPKHCCRHENAACHGDDGCGIGAAILGGLIGGLIGAAM